MNLPLKLFGQLIDLGDKLVRSDSFSLFIVIRITSARASDVFNGLMTQIARPRFAKLFLLECMTQ